MAFKPPTLDFSSGIVKTGGSADFWASNPLPSDFSATGGTTTTAPVPLPDFGQILAGDPFYQAALANLNAQGISDKASRDAALRQAYVRFGDAGTGVDLSFLPADLRAEVSGIITPDVRGLAKQNDTAGLSILARLKDAAQQTAKRTTDVLGSRGLFRSGETGYQFGRNQLYASQANYDATNKFLDYIMGVQAAYVAAERQRQALLLAEQEKAAGNYVPPTAPPPGPAPPGPHSTHSPPPLPDYPLGPGLEPDGSSFPPPPQPTGGPWMPPFDPIADLLKGYKTKGVGGLETQPQ